MNLTRALVFCFFTLAGRTALSTECVAQEIQGAPALPFASDTYIGSGTAPAFSTLTAESEVIQSPLLYFPVGIFEGNVQRSEEKEIWYSQFLFAMAEPSLLPMLKSDGTGATYRFLLLLNHRALSFRLIVNTDGTGNLTSKDVLIQPNGSNSLRVKPYISVSKRQVIEFLALLQRLEFWLTQPEHSGEQNRYRMDDAEWILEGVNSDRYHVVDRWAPKNPDFIRAGTYLMQLAHPER